MGYFRNKKKFQNLTVDEKFNRIQLSADTICKDINELLGFKDMLKGVSETGKGELNPEATREVALKVAELGKNIGKKGWSIIFNLAAVYNIDLPKSKWEEGKDE